jgi:hypothetical protein
LLKRGRKASLLQGNKTLDLPQKDNDILQTLDGAASLQAQGPAIIAGHLLKPFESLIS